ncbi:type I-C CRISPR-associated protein Cas7/Csd2 [Mycobacterium malmoense]|uniref:Type I-C CRISPR-associated protein Cas7/Csd2 n=1 Tax=Mycobacterium malmoense TaxID=1780 RepID=A0ABX3SSU1_MYCMA|nr:type I-C CRISPR-associated protein Cas7/Csd2 [Mycobacterium malmoense]ORA81685.1 type I-C CRISPR-associated protein Cas7/Csd2 [Mycobacterium malmoense]QZA19390.1 type I-C CRISPR-associated protein Cas7/Csd2 [Mycobacterium malmoense]UNB96143.1 type I-C CRISPR-associated protein Cas7/Csd2 [Mycobacterium malmoense]
MTKPAHLDVARRHDFLMLYDVTGGNPNGDPDNEKAPRGDPETGHAWVSDVAIKRKVRSFIADAYAGREGFDIYVGEAVALNQRHRAASERLGMRPNSKRSVADQQKVAVELARRYYDVRAFGAVMSTGDHPAGQLRGPIQIAGISTSVEPVQPSELTITRVAVTKESDLAKFAAGERGGKDREMGTKHVVPYALFRVLGFVTPALAEKTGFDDEDLKVFWDALQRMWSIDRSSSRGMTGCRGIHIFSHDDRYGRCHPDRLFSRVSVTRKVEGPARHFSDYHVDVDVAGLDSLGVTHTLIGD